ncbi:MAG: DUF2017 family protein [Actinomycetes bacterium]
MARSIPWPGKRQPPPLIEIVEGGYRVNLGDVEQRVLRQSFFDLRILVNERDASTRRLFPNAYVDQPQLEAEYQQLVGDDLAQSQLAAIDQVEQSIDGKVVDRAGLEQWMRSINAIRLVIGTKLDISEDPERLKRNDPRFAAYQLYDFLGHLLSWILSALREPDWVDPAGPQSTNELP